MSAWNPCTNYPLKKGANSAVAPVVVPAPFKGSPAWIMYLPPQSVSASVLADSNATGKVWDAPASGKDGRKGWQLDQVREPDRTLDAERHGAEPVRSRCRGRVRESERVCGCRRLLGLTGRPRLSTGTSAARRCGRAKAGNVLWEKDLVRAPEEELQVQRQRLVLSEELMPWQDCDAG